MSCSYKYKSKIYTEQEFKRVLATGLLSELVETNVLTGLDLSNLEAPSEFAVIDQKYDNELKDTQAEYKTELDANEDVVKLRDYIKKNGVEDIIIGAELASKLGMTPMQLFEAKERLSELNTKYRNKFDLLSQERQLEKDLTVGNPVQIKNKETLGIIYEKLFNNTQEQAKAAAEASDKIIGQIAQRSKRTKADVYETITFDKTTQDALKPNTDVLLQNEEPLVRSLYKIGYTSDTEQVARERFDIPNLKKIGQGSDRDVYDLGDGKVVKIAKTARGLQQNLHEGDYLLVDSGVLPKVYEKGLNYVVAEKVEPATTKNKNVVSFLNELKQVEQNFKNKLSYSQRNKNIYDDDFENHGSLFAELSPVLEKYGVDPVVLNYHILGGDFTYIKNWGINKDGKIIHLDGGTFAGNNLISDYKGKKNLDDAEFREIYNRSKQLKKQFGDTDKNTMYQQELSDRKNIEQKAKENGTWLKAPNGEKTNLTEGQWVTVRTDGFKNWFGDWENDPQNSSKGLNKNGEPQVYYTGTSKDFAFNTFKVPKNGTWFVTNPEVASRYSVENDTNQDYYNPSTGKYEDINRASRVYPVFLNIRNVANLKSELTQEQREKLNTAENYKKLQSIYFQNIYFSKEVGNRFDSINYDGDGKTIVVLESPNQIKSATGNVGTFSQTSNNILYQNSNTTEIVAKGFDLVPTKGFGTAFTTKNGKANAALASRINNWLKQNNINDTIFVYESTYGTVNAIPKAQPQGALFQSAQAAIELGLDGKATIYAMTNPNVSSPLHELAHLYEKYLNRDEQKEVLKWANKDNSLHPDSDIDIIQGFDDVTQFWVKDKTNKKLHSSPFDTFKAAEEFLNNYNKEQQSAWTTETSEKFARGFEKYLSEGKSPNSALQQIFDSFKQWLTDIYKGIVGSAIDIELNDAMRDVYARMLGEKFQERPTEEKVVEDKRLTPAKPNDFVHKQVISKAATNYDYVDLLKNNEITKEGIIEAVASAYGTEYAQKYADSVEFRLNGDLSKIDNISEWFKADSEKVVKEAIFNGNMSFAIEHNLIPIGDIRSLVEKYGDSFNPVILSLIKNKIEDYSTEMNAYSQIEDAVAADKTEVTEDTIPEPDQIPEEEKVEEPTLEVEQEETPQEKPAKEGELLDGQEVVYKGENYTIESKDSDGMLNLRPVKGGKLNYAYPQMVQPIVKESARNINHLIRVAERMQQLLPDVQFEFVNVKEDWKGRFKDGKVQINQNLATLDTPIHEFLHPFIAAIRVENPSLYRSLLNDIDPHYVEFVDNLKHYKDLSEEDRRDEALARSLSDNIKETFNSDGTINETQLNKRRQNIIDFIYDWLRKIYSLIFKTEKNVRFDLFVNNLIDSPISSKLRIISENRDEPWKAKVLKFGQDSVLVINKNTYNQNFATPEKIFEEVKPQLSEEDYKELIKESSKAIKRTQGTKFTDFESFSKVTYNKETKKLTFYKEGNSVHSRITPTNGIEDLKNHIPANHLQKVVDAINSSSENIVSYKIEAEMNTGEGTILEAGFNASPGRKITVGEIPANLTIQQLSDLVIGQESLQFDLSTQAETINKLQAFSYGESTEEKVDKFKDNLKKKLAVLEHTASSRIYKGSEALKREVTVLKDVLFNYDDVEVFEQYVKTGLNGLADAHRILREIRESLKEGNLSPQKVNELNRNFQEFNTLYGVYSDVENIFQEYEDYMDDYTVDRYDEIIKTKNRLNNNIKYTAGQLVTAWLYPTYLQQMQYVVQRNPDYAGKILTQDQFANKLRIADKDISIPSYWLGAMINSRDEINSTLAVALADKLAINSNDEVETSLKFQDDYQKFLKDKGLPNEVKAVESYFKSHYLRQAKVWEQVGYDAVKKEAKYDYVDHWAFIREYNEDEWADSLRKEIDKWKDTPQYFQKIKEWHDRNSVNQSAPNSKYLNKDYAKIHNDPFYKTLIDTYEKSNSKYGDRALKYSIIPQAAKDSSWLKGKYEQVKNKAQAAKDIYNNKDLKAGQKVAQSITGAANFMLDADNYESASYMNFDGTAYKNVRSEIVNVRPNDEVSLLLNETVVGMYRDANTFATLREMQANAENLKMLVNGNAAMNIETRKALKTSKNGITFDKILSRPQTDKEATRLNTQLQQNIDDIFYGVNEFPAELKIGKLTINLNTLGRRLGFFTALNNMVLNINGAVSNVTIGNIMTLQERMGGRYIKQGSLRHAYKQYALNTANWMKDLNSPIKSRYTQIAMHYDAIQGEFRDKLGKNITGGLARKMFNRGSLFFMNHAGEHQIQITQMMAMLHSQSVKTTKGETITLDEAWIDNNGKIKLRDDIVWSKESDAQFTRELHRINRTLNGNYSDQHKAVAQRHWWGKAALVYRKYIYEAVRARFAGDRVDLEAGDVIVGYYRNFFKNLVGDLANMKFGILKSFVTAGKKGTSHLTEREQYAVKKTMFDLYLMLGVFALVKGLSGDDDEKKKTSLQAWTLLQLNRTFSDLAMYSIQAPAEISRQVQNPTAIARTLTNTGAVIQQFLVDPTATYDKSGNGYEQGDYKIGTQFRKIVPVWNQIHRFANPEEQLQYFNLSNKKIYN